MDLDIDMANMVVMIVMMVVLVVMLFILVCDFMHQACMPKHVMDRSVRLCKDVSFGQVMLQCFNIMRLTEMMLAHVLFQCCGARFIDLTVSLSVGERLGQTSVLLQDVESHLEDIVHLKLVAEALFLVVRIDVAEGLAPRGMLNSHLCRLL